MNGRSIQPSGSESDHLPTDNRNGSDIIAVNEGQWKDWTSTWRKAGSAKPTRHVTMTGTITRGKKRGESVDVELDLTDHELMQMSLSRDHLNSPNRDARDVDEPVGDGCRCRIDAGPHIILLGILCWPFIFIGSFFVCFYFGLLTWYNIFSYFYDERTICHRITLCPLLVLFFPGLIMVFTTSISFYAAFAQLTCSFEDWRSEVGSFEKGFYGWLCSWLDIESCSPYMVITLTESESPVFQDTPESSRSDMQQNEQNVATVEQRAHTTNQHQAEVHNPRSVLPEENRSTVRTYRMDGRGRQSDHTESSM
ncbi:transmembrane protein 169-like [Ciona intestinalis]